MCSVQSCEPVTIVLPLPWPFNVKDVYTTTNYTDPPPV